MATSAQRHRQSPSTPVRPREIISEGVSSLSSRSLLKGQRSYASRSEIGLIEGFAVAISKMKAMRTFCLRFVFFVFLFFGASAWHRKPPQVYSSVVDTPRHAKISSHSHPQKQSLGLQHNKALTCIPPARSWLLLRVIWQAGLVKVASLFGRQFSS